MCIFLVKQESSSMICCNNIGPVGSLYLVLFTIIYGSSGKYVCYIVPHGKALDISVRFQTK